jgi:hypothetical protein
MRNTCVQLLIAAALGQLAAFAQGPVTVLWVNCGGEGEKPCGYSDPNKGWGLLPANTPNDGTTTNINDTVRCDSGLQLHYDSTTGQVCVNRNRLTVGEIGDTAHNPAPLIYGRENQNDVIQADQPITFAPILASHNSYSNYFDGAQSQFSTDHGFSMTDQLQYGARLIRLDPWLFTNSDFQIKLCHSSTFTETIGKLSVTLDGRTVCDMQDSLGKAISLNRSFIFGIKEVAHWLRIHPNEFVVIRLHDTGQGWGTPSTVNGLVSNDDGTTNAHGESIEPTDCTKPYYAEAVAHELNNMVYQNPNGCTGTPSTYRFPSLRQLRAMHKQVIVLSAYPSAWAFKGADKSGLISVQYSPADMNLLLCMPNAPGSVAQQHTPTTFAETGEDRTLSSPYEDKMVDARNLKTALACGFNEIGLDFLGTLDQAPDPALWATSFSPLLSFMVALGLPVPNFNFQCDDFSQGNSCSTFDTRRDEMTWSWNPGQTLVNEPVRITTGFGDPFASWVSVAHDQTAPYLCAGPLSGTDFPDGTFPDSKAWYVTQTTGPWENGEDACQSEKGSAWHFWHPASAMQNIAAWNTIHNSSAAAAWINHFAGTLQVLPQSLSFTTPQGLIPASKTVVLSGGFGGQVTAIGNPNVSVTSVPLFNTVDSSQTSDDNESNLYTLAFTPQTANLSPGNYLFPVAFVEQTQYNLVSPSNVQTNTCCTGKAVIQVSLTVTAPLTTITSNPPGLTIFVDGMPHKTPYSVAWKANTNHTVDATRPTFGVLGTQALFHDWSDGGAESHQVTATGVASTLTADFQVSYFLTLNTVGPGSATVGTSGGSGYYHAGDVVNITATPQSGSYFIDFSGDLTGPHNPQSIRMDSPHTVTATFGSYAVVHVDAAPDNIQVIADGQSFATPHDFQWTPNSSHVLSFPPTVSLGTGRQLAFTGWSDGDTHNPRTVTAVNGETFTPVFATQDLVTTSVNPPGSGQVTLSGWQNEGSQFQVTATPNGGYAFVSFSGSIQATTSPQTVTVNGPMNVIANFAPATPHLTFSATVIADSDPSAVQLSLGLNNTGVGAITGLSLTLNASQIGGSVPVSNTTALTPLSVAGGSSIAVPLTFNWPSTANRIRLTVSYTGNGGTSQGSQVLSIFR